jgi:hypothetical protein
VDGGTRKLTPRDGSPVKENKSGGASYLSISCRRPPGISTEYRIQVLSLRANDLCFRAGSAIDDGTAIRQRLPNRRVINDLYRQHAPPRNNERMMSIGSTIRWRRDVDGG